MSYRSKLFLLVAVLFVSAGASAAQSSTPEKKPGIMPGVSAQKNFDVCNLLTTADIESVQGAHVEEAKRNAQPASGLLISQCLFRTTSPVKSVSISLAASASQSPKDYWRKQFHSSSDHEKSSKTNLRAKKEDKQADDPEEGSKPRAISGVGDEAYWVGGPISGALYVLRGNNFIRVSVGGVRAVPERIEKSLRLARIALTRM